MGETKFNPLDIVRQNMSSGYNWVFENTVSYKFDIKDKHNFDVLLGMSAEKSGIGEKNLMYQIRILFSMILNMLI